MVTKQNIYVRGTNIEITAYWTLEETPQLKSIEISKKVDTEEEYEENNFVVKAESLEALARVLRGLIHDKRISQRVKKRSEKKSN